MIDAYKIGVSLVMTSNANQVLGVLGRELFGLGKQADALTGKLEGARLAALGAVQAIAGGAILSGMAKLVHHGEKLVHQQALFKAAILDSGLTAQQQAAEVGRATAAAFAVAQQVPGTNVADLAKNISELRTVFGGSGAGPVAAVNATTEAITNLPAVATAQMVLSSSLGGRGEDQVFAFAKALEIKGVSQDPAHFRALLDGLTKAVVASHGKVTGSDFLSAFKYGRTATQGWSDGFVSTVLPTLIQEMKGGGGFSGVTGPGNALQSMFQAVVGGTMTNKAAEEFVHLGLVNPRAIIRTRTGAVKGIRPGGVHGSAEFQTDPYAWVQHHLMPALKAHHITTPDKIREEVAHLFVNRTAQQIATMFATQQMRFEKDMELNKQAGGLDAYGALLKTDPTTQIKAFTEAWNNLLTALGAPLVEQAMHALGWVTDDINKLTAYFGAHPGVAKTIDDIAVAFGVLLTVGGSLQVAAFALGPFTKGLVALVRVAGGAEMLTAGTEMAVVATGLGSVASAIGTLLAPLAALMALLKLGSAYETPETQKQLRDLGKSQRSPPVPQMQLHDGYDEMGRPVPKKQSFIVPPSRQPMIQLTSNINLDGRQIAESVSHHQADWAALPQGGFSGFDTSMSPYSPGQQVRA